jgi:hypothetical protein
MRFRDRKLNNFFPIVATCGWHPHFILGQISYPSSGVLIGLGESRQERLNALREIAECHLSEQGGHVQEVIVQNFR